MKFPTLAVFAVLMTGNVYADNSTLDAAIGGGIGGAAGAAIGNEVGGRDGAIIGGAIGGAAGAAVTTGNEGASSGGSHSHDLPRYHHPQPAQPYYHCPPGQAKKGRC